MDVKKYTDEQLEQIEQIAVNTFGMQSDTIKEYAGMSYERRKVWLTGFGQCIEEAKKVKQSQNNGKPNEGSPNNSEDDGLRHFAKKQQNQESQSDQGQNKKQYDFFDDDKTDNNIQSFKDYKNGNNTPEQQAANKAQQAAESAQQAADAAQQAADAAQQAANKSGNIDDQNNADKAQQAANKAKSAADKAQKSAEESMNKAQQAKNQKDNGDLDGANESARESGRSAQDAGNAASEAGQAASEAGQAASEIGKNQQSDQTTEKSTEQTEQAGQSASQAGQMADQAGQSASQAGEIAEKTAEQSQKTNDNNELGDPNGDLTRTEIDGDINDLHFNATDVCGEDGKDNQQRMEEIAHQAGQDLENSDRQNVIDYQKRMYDQVRNNSRSIGHVGGGGKNRGIGNSLEDVFKKIDELFKPTVNWKHALEKMMNAMAGKQKEDIHQRKRFGVDPSHPLYKGRGLHPDEITEPKKSGIMQVFILVDNSGSMYTPTAHSVDPFTNIMSEIIGLEKKTHIENSALAYFGASAISKEQVRVWKNKDLKNKKALVDYLRQRPGDNGGGTSIALAISSLPQLGRKDGIKLFSQNSSPAKQTLLICISDGYDDYSDISKILTQQEKAKTIFLICNGSDKDLNSTKEKLIEQGIAARHILLVNVLKEW